MKTKRIIGSLLLAAALTLTACGGNAGNASESAAEEEKVLTGESTKGMGGEEKPLKVEVTVKGDTITKVEVKEHGETAGISDSAISDIPAAIVEKGTTEGVEAISGATITSDAIIDAVNNALAGK